MQNNPNKFDFPLLQEHVSNPEWREVLLLLTEMLPQSTSFLHSLQKATNSIIRKP